MEYLRQETSSRPPEERVKDWEPFHIPLPEAVRREQGGRCMNCGVPYCQSGIDWEGSVFGCPLHNLIPEWNDMIYAGNPSHALARLLKTNSFPEFTGRVCPAPCERACICGLYGDAVTIRENELSVIESAFAAGAVKRRRPPQWSGKKVAVVGSGPAGLAAADQLNRRGHSVTVVEREERPGGLLTYGIPNMKLPKTVVARRVELMLDEGVSFVTGVDASDPAVARRLLNDYDAVVLCCGAEKPRPLGLEVEEGVSGILYGTEFLKAAVERTQFGKDLTVPSAEGKDVVIIGTGDTASDCVATALRQGCRSIVQLVRRPREDYLKNGALPLDYAHEEALAVLGEDPRRFGIQAEGIETEAGRLAAVVTSDGDLLPCDLLIAATGFSGCEGSVCDAFGVSYGCTVSTAENSFAASVEKVFAAGDMRRGQSLVVWAIAEGRSVAAEVDAYLMGYTNLVRTV